MENGKNGKRSGRCIAVVGSNTKAMRARQVLTDAAIISDVIKVSGNAFGGCVYGVGFPCVLEGNVRNVLRTAGIGVKRFTDG